MAMTVYGDSVRVRQTQVRGGPAEVLFPGTRTAGNGFDRAVGADHADSVVAGIRDVHLSARTQGDPVRFPELGSRRVSAITAETGSARPCDGLDDSIGTDPANAMVLRVGNQHAAVGVDRYP